MTIPFHVVVAGSGAVVVRRNDSFRLPPAFDAQGEGFFLPGVLGRLVERGLHSLLGTTCGMTS